jgi:hypothetical protein
MNFRARLGMSLLLFGITTLVVIQFGYVPRKLATLTPTQVRIFGASFAVFGALLLGLGDRPRLWKALWIGFLSVTGLALFMALAALLIHHLGRRSLFRRPAPPPPPFAAARASLAAGNSGALTPDRASGAAERPPTLVLMEKKRLWGVRFGREKVWSVVVHLGAKEPPAELEMRLGSMVPVASDGGVFVVRSGGILEAALAPLDDGEKLTAGLAALFPGAKVQAIPHGSRVVVFVR